MGVFDASKCINSYGTIRTNLMTDIVDTYGTIRGSAQFDGAKIVDIFGNLGSIPASGPWEMQLGTVETVGQHLGRNPNNYAASASTPALSSFASAGCTGYIDGVISSNGVWTIQGGTQTIGGVSYAGSGLLIATGANTHTGTINMQAGTNLQLGADCSNTQTKSGGNLTIGAGATCTQYTSYTTTLYLSQALTNTGTYNVTGCGVCGAGGLGRATTVANNGVINIDKAYWGHQSTFSGTGTINVKDGGSLQLSTTTIGGTQTANINGCGWCNAAGVQVGAINATSSGTSYAMKINVQTAACIKTNSNVNVTFAGLLTGSAPLTVGTLGAPVTGITHFTNTANTYSGTITVDGTNLQGSYNNSLQYASIVLVNGGRIGSNANSGQVIKSLASADPTTYWQSGGFNNHTIRANGKTTFAGRLLWAGDNTTNIFLNGPDTNELTLTGIGNTATVYPRNGARLILQGATFTGAQGQVRVQTGSTVSAGTSTTASVNPLYIDGTSKLEVRAVGSGTGLLKIGNQTSVLSAGWKVDAVDPLAPGTYPILSNTGPAITTLPGVGINNTGGTVTFAWNNAVVPRILNMIVT